MRSLASRVANEFLIQQEVVERFSASRPMKPEKLRELMMKVRKWAVTSMKFTDFQKALQAFGGWTIESGPALYSGGEIYHKWGEQIRRSNPDRAVIEAAHEQMAKNVVSHIPSVSQVKLDQQYVMDLTDVEESGGKFQFSYQLWDGEEGVHVTGPLSNETFACEIRTYERESVFVAHVKGRGSNDSKRENLLDWLKPQLIKQVNDLLGTETLEAEKERKQKEKKQQAIDTGKVGTCGCCFGTFKLIPVANNGSNRKFPGMTLHGYQRPGIGYILGTCFGVGWPPFELSDECSKEWRKTLKSLLDTAEKTLRYFRSGDVEMFGDRQDPRKYYKKSEMPADEWDRLLKQKIEDKEVDVRNMEYDIRKLDDLIRGWEFTPIPGVAV